MRGRGVCQRRRRREEMRGAPPRRASGALPVPQAPAHPPRASATLRNPTRTRTRRPTPSMPASRVRSPARHTCSDPVTPAFGTSSSASQPGTSTGCVWGFRRTDSCAEVIVGKGGRRLVRGAGALSCPGVRGSSGVEANEEEGADGARRMANGVRAFTLTIFLPSPASELRQKGRRKSDALLLGADDRAQAPVQLLRVHRGPRGIAYCEEKMEGSRQQSSTGRGDKASGLIWYLFKSMLIWDSRDDKRDGRSADTPTVLLRVYEVEVGEDLNNLMLYDKASQLVVRPKSWCRMRVGSIYVPAPKDVCVARAMAPVKGTSTTGTGRDWGNNYD
ncbi:hypothetical protein FB451DRAFT_1190394 [Mycena latifolia]|nr:hypothetical protein FB451DRAFT_1190394 [Mycena latifolia]